MATGVFTLLAPNQHRSWLRIGTVTHFFLGKSCARLEAFVRAYKPGRSGLTSPETSLPPGIQARERPYKPGRALTGPLQSPQTHLTECPTFFHTLQHWLLNFFKRGKAEVRLAISRLPTDGMGVPKMAWTAVGPLPMIATTF